MTQAQEQINAIAQQLGDVSTGLTTGVQELRDEVDRLAAVNPAINFGPIIDKLGPLVALRDQLAGDNIPAAPVDVPPADVPAEDPLPLEG